MIQLVGSGAGTYGCACMKGYYRFAEQYSALIQDLECFSVFVSVVILLDLSLSLVMTAALQCEQGQMGTKHLIQRNPTIQDRFYVTRYLNSVAKNLCCMIPLLD